LPNSKKLHEEIRILDPVENQWFAPTPSLRNRGGNLGVMGTFSPPLLVTQHGHFKAPIYLKSASQLAQAGGHFDAGRFYTLRDP
jgi:hypothetical protein